MLQADKYYVSLPSVFLKAFYRKSWEIVLIRLIMYFSRSTISRRKTLKDRLGFSHLVEVQPLSADAMPRMHTAGSRRGSFLEAVRSSEVRTGR